MIDKTEEPELKALRLLWVFWVFFGGVYYLGFF